MDKKNDLSAWMGKRIQKLRLEAGFSQNAFARELGVARMTLVNIENGIQTITNWILFNAAVLIGVHVSEFFPAQDKNGNFITQGEYKDLSEQYPEDYPIIEFKIEKNSLELI